MRQETFKVDVHYIRGLAVFANFLAELSRIVSFLDPPHVFENCYDLKVAIVELQFLCDD